MKKQPSRQTRLQLISILMPTHNAAAYLSEAIESIQKQTHTNWELLCVNDASTDTSLDILKSYASTDKRIKIFENTSKKGIGYSLNIGLKHAKGKYIARMDADDISLPERLEKQLDLLEKKSRIVACGGQAAMIDGLGNIFAYKRFPTDSKILYNMIMRMVPIQHPILMTRASILKGYRYNEERSTAEDVDMLFYLLSRGKLSNVDSLIYHYRKADTSNGYHNVKKTFFLTLASRFEAIAKYGYKPSLSSLVLTLAQFVVVSLLPSRLVVKLFEAYRLDHPLWKQGLTSFGKPINVLLPQPILK